MLYYKGICQLTDMRRSEHDILHELFNVREARTCPSTDGRHGGTVLYEMHEFYEKTLVR